MLLVIGYGAYKLHQLNVRQAEIADALAHFKSLVQKQITQHPELPNVSRIKAKAVAMAIVAIALAIAASVCSRFGVNRPASTKPVARAASIAPSAAPASQQTRDPAPAPEAEATNEKPAQATPGTNDGEVYPTSFDCSRSKSIPEYLICHDPDLAAADRDLAVTYQKANGAVSDKAALFDRARKQWNFRERNCRDKACLLSWYQYESNTFNTIAQTGNVNAQVEQSQ